MLGAEKYKSRIAGFVFLLLLIFSLALLLLQTDNEHDVYEALLTALSQKIPVSEFSFYSHPTTCRSANQDDMPQASLDLFDDFHEKNDVRRKHPGVFYISHADYNIVSMEDSLKIYTAKTPELKNIPTMLINLSRIGFDESMTSALVCVESQESGDLVLLVKTDKVWHVSEWRYVW